MRSFQHRFHAHSVDVLVCDPTDEEPATMIYQQSNGDVLELLTVTAVGDRVHVSSNYLTKGDDMGALPPHYRLRALETIPEVLVNLREFASSGKTPVQMHALCDGLQVYHALQTKELEQKVPVYQRGHDVNLVN